MRQSQLVAERIVKYANFAGRENVIAGSDCGFATFAGSDEIDPAIAWAKLESLARGAPLRGRTDLFVTPGFEFRRVDSLLTNFHLPRSTLLALVMAFCGVEETRRLYRLAIDERYRFYSFGDAMLVR